MIPKEFTSDCPEFVFEDESLRHILCPSAPQTPGKKTPGFARNTDTLSRHIFISGESGSGKTKFVLIPILKSLIDYKLDDGKKCGILVVDPKHELLEFIKQDEKEKNRLMIVGDPFRVNYFEETDVSELDQATGAFEKVLKYGANLTTSPDSVRDPYWNLQVISIFNAIVEIDFWICRELKSEDLVSFKKSRADKWKSYWSPDWFPDKDEEEFTKIIELSYTNYIRFITSAFYRFRHMSESANESPGKPADESEKKKKHLIAKWKAHLPKALANFVDLEAATTKSIIVSMFSQLEPLCSDMFAKSINCWPYSTFISTANDSIKESILKGKILVIQPKAGLGEISDTIGRLVKAKFFEMAFLKNNIKDGQDTPFAYVCDEFQRYITDDQESGEYRLLDACRAFRGICVLATQSIASLKAALGPGSDAKIDVILNNTGNKFFLRNTEASTVGYLNSVLPTPPVRGYPKILEVRPLISLVPGECYYLVADGKWGRKQLPYPQYLKKEPKPVTNPQKTETNPQETEETEETETITIVPSGLAFRNWDKRFSKEIRFPMPNDYCVRHEESPISFKKNQWAAIISWLKGEIKDGYGSISEPAKEIIPWDEARFGKDQRRAKYLVKHTNDGNICWCFDEPDKLGDAIEAHLKKISGT